MKQVFVGNLAYSISEQQLRSLFEAHGRVSSVRLPQDRSTGKPRGFAFVSMSRAEDAEEAIARLNGIDIGGRRIVVNKVNDDDEAPPVNTGRQAAMALWNSM